MRQTAPHGDDAVPSAASSPYLSLSEITVPDTSFAEDVALVAAAGIDGLGIWGYKLEGVEIADAAARLDEAGLRSANCIPVGNSVFPYTLSPEPADPARRVEALRREIVRLAPLAPESIVVITGPAPEGDAARALETCREAYASLAETASGAGLRLSIEPMHPAVAADLCLFDSVGAAGAFVEEVGDPALGILVDSWHVAADPHLREALHANAQRIYGVHLADHRAGATRWTDRAVPGEGLGDARRLVELLREIHFAGALDVEIFSDDGRYGGRVDDSLWELPPEQLVARCARFRTG
ncbi:MAG TPA: sugar phosphate isomerase/epimerase [Gaiellaceae bacterium]|nr:sugar phosphate isomerase/epimerase [Gaiellaceae bacterium]